MFVAETIDTYSFMHSRNDTEKNIRPTSRPPESHAWHTYVEADSLNDNLSNLRGRSRRATSLLWALYSTGTRLCLHIPGTGHSTALNGTLESPVNRIV